MGASGTASMPHAMRPGFDPRRTGATGHWQDASAPGQMAFYDGAAYDRGLLYYRAGEFGAYHPAPGYGVSGVYGGVPASQPAAFHPAALNPAAAYGNANQWASWEHHAARFGGAPGYAGGPGAPGPPGSIPVGGAHTPYDMAMGGGQAGGALGGGWRAGYAAGGAPGGWLPARGAADGGFLLDPMRGGAAVIGAQGAPHMQGGASGYRVAAPADARPGPESRAAAGLHTVHVRDVPVSATERDVAAAFEACGPVADCRLCSDPQSGARYAFVAFPTKAAARAALSKSGSEIGGHPVRVVLSRTSVIPVNPSLLPQGADELERCARTVYVANVHRASREEDVRAFFQTETADVTGVLLNPRVAGQVAFVEFATVDAAQAALRRSGRELDGRALRVSQSKTPLRLGGAKGHGAGRASAGAARAFARATTSGPGSPAPPSEPAPPGQRTARGHNRDTLGSAPPPVLARTGARSRIPGASVGSSGSGSDPRSGTSPLSPGNPPRMWHAVRVSHVPATVTESELARIFSGCGRVLDCRLSGDAHSTLRAAFVAFPDAVDVENALSLDGFTVDGVALAVRRSVSAVVPVNPELLPRSEADVERCMRTVYVSNVCAGVSAATLRAVFEDACGEVRNMHQQLAAGRETQVTFVEFAAAESAAKALALSGRVVGSGRVRVSPSKTPLKANKQPPPTKSRAERPESGPERQKAGSAAAASEGEAKKSAPAEGAPPAAASKPPPGSADDGAGAGDAAASESVLEREIKKLDALAVASAADDAAAEAARRKSNDSVVSGSSEGDTAVA
jgi:RNA recognition motif-containing protein